MKEAKPINRRRAQRKRNEIALRKAVRSELARAQISLLRHASRLLKSDDPLEGWKWSFSGLLDELDDILSDTFADGASIAAQQLKDMDVELRPDFSDKIRSKATAYASKRGADLVTQISESIRDDMRTQIFSAIQAGLSTDEFAKLLEKRYAFSDTRAERIARTEMAFADVEGNMSAYKAAGVELKQWITAEDDKVSPECAMNGSQGPIPFNANFASGAFQPPEHPNCRCDVIPVIK